MSELKHRPPKKQVVLSGVLRILDVYTGASRKNPAAGSLLFFMHTAVWAALKKLGMGLGLILLFSSILLISDLGHRKSAAASSLARAQAGAAGRSVKAAIVYF